MHLSTPISNAITGPFKRAQLGLFQGRTKQYGNNVPFSKHKTRRTWLPNVQRKHLFSETLGGEVRLNVTTRALKTIKKYGGLDNYVLNTKANLLGWEGMRIRLLVQDRLAEQEREARRLSDIAATNQVKTTTTGQPSNSSAHPLKMVSDPDAQAVPANSQTSPSTPLSTHQSQATPRPRRTPIPDKTIELRRKVQYAQQAHRAQAELDHFTKKRPTLANARKAREEAKLALGLSWADASSTIKYLAAQRRARDQLLGL